MTIPFRSALLVLCAAGLVFADNYPRQAGIDAQHYVMRITLNDDNDAIAGESTVTLRFVKDGVREFALDLTSATNGKGMTVDAVTENSAALTYLHRDNRLTITLPSAPGQGSLHQYTIRYHGVPSDGLRAVKNKYGDRCFFSQNWPDLARQWMPMIDHPYDKATSEFLITAPAKYQVVANGLLQEEIDLPDGRRMTHWKQSVPIASWLNNIGVAQFAALHFGKAAGVPLQTWVFPKDRDAGILTFNGPMRQAIEFFSDHIGPYPYEKLASVQNGAANGGGMEHASEIFYGQNAANGRPNLPLVSHETAHQWFGDSVTEKDWDDVWLSEGFATYFAALTTEHYEGRDAFVNQMKRSRSGIFTTEKRLQGVAVVQTKEWKGIPNGIVYQKGAWSLHMLRGQIGADKFWAGIREYYRRYRDSNASTADFKAVMEEVSGADLDWFFQQWIYRPGSPAVEGTWQYDAAAKKVKIELSQTQPGEPYRLPLEIGLTNETATKVEKVELSGKHQSFELDAAKEPSAVTLDPNVWLLVDSRFERK
ncbi:MAG TPA: M1 family aminopeptidase [Candidatus Sulfopaludibacter sp.]|jgi:aminopeptidase N|nr:M1 family aminopeptidase [Candidatus Sulfopaludibacter sp.]